MGHSSARSSEGRQLLIWGGAAGILGATFLVASGVVVGLADLPDASDVETLTDFADIEAGRIAEHLLYLGSLMAFALHAFVLHRVVQADHPAASLFGSVFSGFGLVIMAAGSLLHVSTSPLSELYTDPTTPVGDLKAIEYAWHGAQSIFDTMLATGVLLVPIGIFFFGLAMQASAAFSTRYAMLALALGAVGGVAAVVAIIDPGSQISAIAVVAIAVFHLAVGWRTLSLREDRTIDLRSTTPSKVAVRD